MLRVFSPTGCNVNLPPVTWVLNQDLQGFLDFTDVGLGGFSWGFWVLAAGFLNQDLQDFEDYRERLRFSSRGYS
jgi:hypothetical protein